MFFVLDEIASFAFSLDILFKRQVMQSYSLSLIENLARLLRVVLRKISARSRTSECGDCWTTVRSEGGKAELARPPPSVSGYRDNWPWMCRVQRRSRRRPSTIRPVSFHVRYSRFEEKLDPRLGIRFLHNFNSRIRGGRNFELREKGLRKNPKFFDFPGFWSLELIKFVFHFNFESFLRGDLWKNGI